MTTVFDMPRTSRRSCLVAAAAATFLAFAFAFSLCLPSPARADEEPAAAAADKDIHIPPGRAVGFNWYVDDGAGMRWDITAVGQVADGTNDAYDGGMQLRIGGTAFASSTEGRLSPDNREVEIGPWRQGDIQVYRRIYVDPKMGYCRWIDLFENTGKAPQEVAIQHYTNVGGSINMVATTTGAAKLAEADWGIVTAGTDTSTSRPAIVHVWGDKNARMKPKFRYDADSDNIYYDMKLKIPAGKTLGVCLFDAQVRTFDQAKTFLKDFNPRTEMNKVPAGLRKIIVNMGGATLLLGEVNLPRHEQHDLAVLRNENELLGKILNERFDVETFYGKLELPAKQVIGLSVPAADDPHVQVVLVDGQVVAGKLLNAPIRMRLTNGNEMALPPNKLAAASFALSSDKPGDVRMARPTVSLRSGQQLAFHKEDLDGSFQTQYGVVALNMDDLRGIQFDTPEGGLHRAQFRNGSVLSGLLSAEELKLNLELGPTLRIRRQMARQILLPATDADSSALTELTLRNDDVLFGRIDQDSLTVATQYGNITVKPAEIAEVQVPEESTLGQVQIKLQSGTTVSGKFTGDAIRFQVEPGPKLSIAWGHVAHLTCPKPPGAATTTAPAGPRPSVPGPVTPAVEGVRTGPLPPGEPPVTPVPAGPVAVARVAVAVAGPAERPAPATVTPAGEIPRPEPVRLAATRPAAAPTTTAPAAATPTTRTAATAGEETLAALQAQREALLAQLADARARQDKFVATVNQAAARSDTAAGENARRAVAECQTMIKAIEARITAVQKNIVARTPVPK